MTGGGGATLDGAANSDGGGPYPPAALRQHDPLLLAANGCPAARTASAASQRYNYTSVRITEQHHADLEAIDNTATSSTRCSWSRGSVTTTTVHDDDHLVDHVHDDAPPSW